MRWLSSIIAALSLFLMGAGYRTPNFVVNASTPELAQSVAEAAEYYRTEHAKHWLGYELPRWAQPCPVAVQDGNIGAGGATSFRFTNGEVHDWNMSIQGTPQSIIDSVLPHEVLHAVFASHFRQPLPRWADEGACTTVESASEKNKHRQMLVSFLKEDRGIATGRLVTLKEYPPDVMPLYAQGFVMTQFLIDQRGRPAFVIYLADGLTDGNWQRATEAHYGYRDLTQFQEDWLAWFKGGMKPNAQLVSYQPPCASGNCPPSGPPSNGGFRPSNPGMIRPAQPYLDQPDPQPPKPVAPLVPAQPIVQSPPVKGCECDNASIMSLIAKIDARQASFEQLLVKIEARQTTTETNITNIAEREPPEAPAVDVPGIVAAVVDQMKRQPIKLRVAGMEGEAKAFLGGPPVYLKLSPITPAK
jgi:hypothetical protein